MTAVKKYDTRMSGRVGRHSGGRTAQSGDMATGRLVHAERGACGRGGGGLREKQSLVGYS